MDEFIAVRTPVRLRLLLCLSCASFALGTISWKVGALILGFQSDALSSVQSQSTVSLPNSAARPLSRPVSASLFLSLMIAGQRLAFESDFHILPSFVRLLFGMIRSPLLFVVRREKKNEEKTRVVGCIGAETEPGRLFTRCVTKPIEFRSSGRVRAENVGQLHLIGTNLRNAERVFELFAPSLESGNCESVALAAPSAKIICKEVFDIDRDLFHFLFSFASVSVSLLYLFSRPFLWIFTIFRVDILIISLPLSY